MMNGLNFKFDSNNSKNILIIILLIIIITLSLSLLYLSMFINDNMSTTSLTKQNYNMEEKKVNLKGNRYKSASHNHSEKIIHKHSDSNSYDNHLLQFEELEKVGKKE
jgi:hypothetical protein